MLAFVIAPFVIALLILVFIRTIKHIHQYNFKNIKLIEMVFGLFLFGGFIFCALSFLIKGNYELKRFFTRLAYNYIAIWMYIGIGLLIALIIRWLIWMFIHKNRNYNKSLYRNITIIFVTLFTSIMMIYGTINAHKLYITNYEIQATKKSQFENLNIVLIADLHIGYNVNLKHMQDMVEKINSQNPDIVILAGDIFDSDYEAIENPEEMIKVLSSINSKYGKYAVYGNHDIQEKVVMGFTFNNSGEDKKNSSADERMVKFIEDIGFTALYDSYVSLGDIYIYGRPDSHKINFGNMTRIPANEITKGLNLDSYIICVDHEPKDLEELSKAGVDLDLSGHTHNGQFWPGTISIDWIWDNAYGLKQIGDKMISIVTSGVGLFGFDIRTGCFAEICAIDINFN